MREWAPAVDRHAPRRPGSAAKLRRWPGSRKLPGAGAVVVLADNAAGSPSACEQAGFAVGRQARHVGVAQKRRAGMLNGRECIPSDADEPHEELIKLADGVDPFTGRQQEELHHTQPTAHPSEASLPPATSIISAATAAGQPGQPVPRPTRIVTFPPTAGHAIAAIRDPAARTGSPAIRVRHRLFVGACHWQPRRPTTRRRRTAAGGRRRLARPQGVT